MIAMFRMNFSIKGANCLAGKETDAVVEVVALNGQVFAKCGSAELSMTPKQANDLMFALRKAQYEAKLQRKGGEK
jgi:hypothetical protein